MNRILQLLAALCLLQAGHAAVPDAISFQGRALTATGEALGKDGAVNRLFTLRIWDDATSTAAANLIYSEQQVVSIIDGAFSVLIGTGTPTTGTKFSYSETAKGPPTVKIGDAVVFGGASRYVGITIDDGTPAVDNEILPRQQVVSAPFATRAKLAEGVAAGAVTTARIANNAVTPAALADGAVTASKLASDLEVTNTHFADGSITSAKIAAGAVTAAQLADGSITSAKIAAGALSLGKLQGYVPPGMAYIPGGTYTQGNSVAADTDITDAAPVITTVSPFYMDVNLVTHSLWLRVSLWATDNGYGFATAGSGRFPHHPVHTISWYDAVKWCNARSVQEGLTPVYYTDTAQTTIYKSYGNVDVTHAMVKWTANGYRLPTEAEWERAARGGLNGQRFPWGNLSNTNLANYYGQTAISYDLGPQGWGGMADQAVYPATSPVGSYPPNGYGLHDMAGNLHQWCWDWYGTTYAGGSNPRGPAEPRSGWNPTRVLRGGSWDSGVQSLRVASRGDSFAVSPQNPGRTLGFRVVRSSVP